MAASVTPADAVKTFVCNLQKKQRNLVKRKGKLDHYRELLNKGETLNEEQKKAVEGYEGVLQSITLLQEIMTQSKELVDDVESAIRQQEKLVEDSIEQHTLSFLRTHVCLMQLISALDNPDLRTAIIKSASPHHLTMLDTIRDLFAVRIVNWPRTNGACLSSMPEFIQGHSEFDITAKHIHNLILGRPVPIPVPEDYEGPQRKFNFKEARALCFRLLATPAVQRCLGSQAGSKCSISHPTDDIKHNQVSNPCDTHETRQEFVPHEPSDRPRDHTAISAAYDNHLPHRPVEHDTISGVVGPLGGTFNFLQASKVMSPEPVLEYPRGQLNHQESSHVHTNAALHPTEPTTTQLPTDGEEFREGAEHVYNEVHPHHFEQSPPPTFTTPSEPVHTLPLSETEPAEAVSSKPSCYADLFRRQSQGNKPNDHRGSNVRRVERTQVSAPAEFGETKTFVDAELPTQPPSRGRGGGGDFRGGRGHPVRGYSRGFMNGPSRRPYGGPRIGRGGGMHSGRGRANLHGAPRTNVAEA